MMGFPEGKLKELLIACATAVEEDKEDRVGIAAMVAELRKMVSKSGDPFERLGAYMLEALVERMDSSGHSIYKDLKAKEAARPPDLLSYMNFVYNMLPQIRFGYMLANDAILRATRTDDRIHIIDFSIGEGDQWVTLFRLLSRKPGKPPSIRMTGICDIVPARSRDSKLELIERRLSQVAHAYRVPFEFHAVAISGDQVEEGHLAVIPRPGEGGVQQGEEAVVVNFTTELHNISNRDRILRLVKSLSPRVVTLVEQEYNINSANFSDRVVQTLDYYAAVFDSMDVTRSKEDMRRVDMEQQFLASEMVNIISCQGADSVERQWKPCLLMADFTPYPLCWNDMAMEMLHSYDSNYLHDERDGVVYLRWKDRPLVVASAWH